ncbi:MAG: sterol desaturase family protein [Proteobacteria bacterium]|nr:sterol desaturase family protein [Pseudomonadota bacterium]
MISISIVNFLIGIPLGLFVENVGEWVMHRYILHGLGKRPGSLWSYHWHEHHRICRQNRMIDPGYNELPLRWNTQGKEVLFLVVVALIHAPLISFVPGYVSGMYAALAYYYYKHRKAHLEPAWAKTHLPWHWEHHMGNNSDANWCVTWNWFDRLMKTHVNRE